MYAKFAACRVSMDAYLIDLNKYNKIRTNMCVRMTFSLAAVCVCVCVRACVCVSQILK